MTEVRIEGIIPQGECDYSGGSGELIVVSTADGKLNRAKLLPKELTRHLIFWAKQASANDSNANTPKPAGITD